MSQFGPAATGQVLDRPGQVWTKPNWDILPHLSRCWSENNSCWMMSWWFCVVFAWAAQSPQKDCQIDAKYNFWTNKSERIPKQFSPINTFVRPPITTVETYVETYVELSLFESWPRVPELIWNLIERNHGDPTRAHIGNAQIVAPSGSRGRHYRRPTKGQ